MGLKAKHVQEIMQQKDELGFHPRQCWEILVNLKEQSAFLVPAAKIKFAATTTTNENKAYRISQGNSLVTPLPAVRKHKNKISMGTQI